MFKVKRSIYLKDEFVDYEGLKRPVIMCAVSVIPDDGCKDYKAFSIGISVCHKNDINNFNEELGKTIAYNKAISFKNVPLIETNTPGLISAELVDLVMKKEMQRFKENPGEYLAGYKDAQKKYFSDIRKKEINELTSKVEKSLNLPIELNAEDKKELIQIVSKYVK